MPDEALLHISHLTHRFCMGKSNAVYAVRDVSFSLAPGEIFGLVGESGSGKSTLANCILRILRPDAGEIFYRGINLCNPKEAAKNHRLLSREIQLIFQDSAAALNPRLSVRSILSEPLLLHRLCRDRSSREDFLRNQLSYVGLEPEILEKYPFELSGGQRQRVGIARALCLSPKLIVADEPVSSLDVSIQAQIINLFSHLQKEHGFTFLFIAHDLSMVRFLCDRVGVLCRGRLVELGKTADVFAHPLHPYTKSLLSAVPVPDPAVERTRTFTPFSGTLPEGGQMREAAPGHFVL